MLNVYRVLAAIVSRLGRNAVPLAAVFAWDWAPINALWLYLGENVVTMILAAVAVRMLTPEIEVIERKELTRTDLLKSFFLVGGGFTVVTAVIVAVAVLAREEFVVNFPELFRALGMMLLFHLVGFTAHIRRPRMLLAEGDQLLANTLGRVLLLAFAIWLGLFLGFVFTPAFVIPFMLLKLVGDVWGLRPEALKRRVMIQA